MSKSEQHLVDGKYTFQDLVDMDRLRSMFEHFARATGLTTALTAFPTQELLIMAGWQKICSEFHRALPASEAHCKQSNLELTAKLEDLQELNIRVCENGLVDGATPIIVGGVHIADLWGGQVLFEEPDFDRFRAQAERYGYDVDAYLEALAKVPIVKEEELKSTMTFLSELSVMLAEQALLGNRLVTSQMAANAEYFRELVESFGDWIWEVDARGVYTYASPQVETVLGYKPAEVVGRSPFDLMPPEEAERVGLIFRDLVSTGASITALENINLHKDGRLVVIETHGVPVLDKTGAVIGYRGKDRDITERKRAAEELSHLRNYLSSIIDSMPSVLIGVDLNGRVTQWNNEAQRATGLGSEAALGQPLQQVFPQLAGAMARVHEAVTAREVRTESRRLWQQNGESHYVDVAVYPLLADGIEGAVIRVDDVTERVRIEEMMVQSEKMLSVGGLAAGMAHEINNPLGGMIQTASVMSDRLTDPALPANIRAAQAAGTSMEAIAAFMEARDIIKMLERIRDAGGRAAEIITNMLSFARMGDSSPSSCDLRELLDKCVDLAGSDYDLRKRYDFRRIEMVREYAEDLPYVPCESGKIRQVLLNILRNGAEAMQEGAAAGSEKPPRFILRLAHDKTAGMVRLEIEDNGPGMDEATRKRVFEPFFTTKPTGRGTGLGLSVSYFIITENHGGEMSVESTPGTGTKFIITLPVKRQEKGAP